MNLHDGATLYDVLDLASSASPQEVREAYIRTKSTFNRDSIALYTIISPEEREETLRKIEEAYLILSNPEKRREYDQNFGIHGAIPKIVSIDRVPPMENVLDGEAIFIPPKTDFAVTPDAPGKSESQRPAPTPTSAPSTARAATQAPSPPPPAPPSFSAKPLLNTSRPPSRAFKGIDKSTSYSPRIDSMLAHAIDVETEWNGSFLKKIREAYKISLEEMAGITKITKTYLIAIEEEAYAKLPAPVYIRGFVAQVAKVLKLPHEKVASAYLSRYHRNQTE